MTKKEEFISILKATERDGIDYVIEDLEAWGFFEAPASKKNHQCYPGGLLEHSLNVYHAAMMLKQGLMSTRGDVMEKISDDSIAIATLLHDVCKSRIYRRVSRKVKNEIGMWETVEDYNIDYSDLPVGHGEKSVILLLSSGLLLNDDEICAIRWHMGAWDLPFQSSEMVGSINKARDLYPLVGLVQTSDTVAANLIERKELTGIKN